MRFNLPDTAATEAFGHLFAHALQQLGKPVPVLFYGELGAGKTTMISALVKALPGGDMAETSSPSFTLYNMYPTTPPVVHCDLYRQENGAVDESLLDFLDDGRHLVLIEWAQRLPGYALPPNRIKCVLREAGPERIALITPFGATAARIAELLCP